VTRGGRDVASELERSLRQLGLPLAYTLATELSEHSGLAVHIRKSTKNAGYFRASDASGDYGWREDADPGCARAFGEIRRMEPRIRSLWVVRAVELFDPKLHGQGFATAIYKVLLDTASRHGAVLGPHNCIGGGSTSESAGKVWNRIGGKAHGPWRWNPALLPISPGSKGKGYVRV